MDKISRLFWSLTLHQLDGRAQFHKEYLRFTLQRTPVDEAPEGQYAPNQKGESLPEHCHLYRLSHPLGEYVLDSSRRQATPLITLMFQLSNHPVKLSGIEPFLGQSGWLELNLLELESFQREECLVFTALTDDRAILDQELCAQLFQLEARTMAMDIGAENSEAVTYLEATARRQLDACLSKALEENNEYFHREREKLDAWSQDQVSSAEAKRDDTRTGLKEAKKQARIAVTMEEQKQAQEKVKQLERQQRRQRQEIFDVEDEIEERRDSLINALEQQMHQRSNSHQLFWIRWQIV